MNLLIATFFGLALLTMGCDMPNSAANEQETLFAKNATGDAAEASGEEAGLALGDQESSCGALEAPSGTEDPESMDMHTSHHGAGGSMEHRGHHGLGLKEPIFANVLAACRADESCDLGTAIKEALASQQAELTALEQTFSTCSSNTTCNFRDLFAATLAKAIEAASPADVSADSLLPKPGLRISWAPPQVLWCYFDQSCDLAASLAAVLDKQIKHLTAASTDLAACLTDKQCKPDQLIGGQGLGAGPARCPHRDMEMSDRGMSGKGPRMMEGSGMPGGHGRGRR